MYYNGSKYDYSFVIAKETHIGNTTFLDYVYEVKMNDGKFHISWTQEIELAETYSINHYLSKEELKLSLEQILKTFGLYGKASIFQVQSILRVKNKIV